MKKKLIVSGCSFTSNHFRSAVHPEMDLSWPRWPELLAKELNMECVNLAISGQGNDFILGTLQDYVLGIKDKSEIGLVIAAWSQCFRLDYQEGNNWKAWIMQQLGGFGQAQRLITTNEYNEFQMRGDIEGWVRKSLRLYMNFQIMCERYDIPYLQTQMIPLYIDYLRGLFIVDKKLETWRARQQIVDIGKADESILEAIMEYDNLINHDNFLGWPISKKLGGFSLNLKAFKGYEKDDEEYMKCIISDTDSHPNALGNKILAKHFKEKYEKINS